MAATTVVEIVWQGLDLTEITVAAGCTSQMVEIFGLREHESPGLLHT